MEYIRHKTPKHEGTSEKYMKELAADFKQDYPELMNKYTRKIEEINQFLLINLSKQPMIMGAALGSYVLLEKNLKSTHFIDNTFNKGICGIDSILSSIVFRTSSSQIEQANNARKAYDLAQTKETIISKIDKYKNSEKGIPQVLDIDNFKVFMQSTGPMQLLHSLYMDARTTNLTKKEFEAARFVNALAHIPKQTLLENFTAYSTDALYNEPFEEQKETSSYEEVFERIVLNKETVLDWNNIITHANNKLSRIITSEERKTYCINIFDMVSHFPIHH